MTYRIIISLLVAVTAISQIGCGKDTTTSLEPESPPDQESHEETTPTEELPPYFGEWELSGGKTITITTTDWNGKKIESSSDEGYVIVSETVGGTTSYTRIDWIVDPHSKKLLTCESQPSTDANSLKTTNGINRKIDPNVGGCYGPTIPWVSADPTPAISGVWSPANSKGAVSIWKSSFNNVLRNDKFIDLDVTSFTNKPGSIFLSRTDHSTTMYSRFLWKKKNRMSFRGCFDIEDSADANTLNSKVTLTDDAQTGCNGKPWVTYYRYNDLALNGLNLAEWRNEANAQLDIKQNRFNGSNIVATEATYGALPGTLSSLDYFVTQESGANKPYSLVVYNRDSWRMAHYCVVNQDATSIDDALTKNISNIKYDYQTGCNNQPWTEINSAFWTSGTSLLTSWQAKSDMVNYFLDSRWLFGHEIVAFDGPSNFLVHIYTDASSQEHIIKTYLKPEKESTTEKEILYYCDAVDETGISSITDFSNFLLDQTKKPDFTDLATGCNNGPWLSAYKSWEYSGFYKSSGATPQSYEISPNSITIDSNKEELVTFLADKKNAILKDSSGKFRQLAFTKDSNDANAIYICEVTPSQSTEAQAKNPTYSVNYDDINTGCGSKAWTKLESKPSQFTINGIWHRTTKDPDPVPSIAHIDANQWDDVSGSYLIKGYTEPTGTDNNGYITLAVDPTTTIYRLVTDVQQVTGGGFYFYACDVTAPPTTLPVTVTIDTDCPNAYNSSKWVKFSSK